MLCGEDFLFDDFPVRRELGGKSTLTLYYCVNEGATPAFLAPPKIIFPKSTSKMKINEIDDGTLDDGHNIKPSVNPSAVTSSRP